VPLILFRKRKIDHGFFGTLVYTGGQWEGSKLFPPIRKSVYLYLSGDEKGVRDEYIDVWKTLLAQYSLVLDLTVEKSREYFRGLDRVVVVDPDNLDAETLELEGISFGLDSVVTFYWGVRSRNEVEPGLELVTSFSDSQVKVLGIGD
jgi:hypothetical protein